MRISGIFLWVISFTFLSGMENHQKLKKHFYDTWEEFTARTLAEYYISPGTHAKFDLIRERIGSYPIHNAIDLGCSGNSILHFLSTPQRKFFLDLAQKPLFNYRDTFSYFPIMGSVTQLPFPTAFFDFVSALDVLEHIKNDKVAAQEMARILQPRGILVLSVPHLQKNYTYQDQIIGHYRRYSLVELDQLLNPLGFRRLTYFGVYGQMMRIQMIQASIPDETEDTINNLRNKYFQNALFRKWWDRFIQIMSRFMKWDAKYQPLKKILNLCVIYQKIF